MSAKYYNATRNSRRIEPDINRNEPKRIERRKWLIRQIGGYSPFIVWYRAARPIWLWKILSPLGRPTLRYIRENGWRVQRGPFSGLVFPPRALARSNYLSSKLSGTYEAPVIAFLAEHAPSSELFVDLGSGDGFFLTGVALLNRGLKAIGFEINSYETTLAGHIAAINGVPYDQRGRATLTALKSLPEGNLLLLCDLEGVEEDLLDPVAVPRLQTATMIVEAHEQFRPNVVSTLRSRFSKTHEMTWIGVPAIDSTSLPEFDEWPREEASLAIFDGHSEPEGWMVFIPRVAN